jgi:hypothetical protein
VAERRVNPLFLKTLAVIGTLALIKIRVRVFRGSQFLKLKKKPSFLRKQSDLSQNVTNNFS